jgi:bacillopeptidase F (M6 metalloprotease family)
MDTSYNIVEVLMWRLSDSQTWTNLVFDLSKYRGWTLLLQWGTYNDGGGGTSAMYVDDVTLQACH